MKAQCVCGYQNVKIIEEQVEVYINGVKISCMGKVMTCCSCGEEIIDKDLIEENLKIAHGIYNNMQKG